MIVCKQLLVTFSGSFGYLNGEVLVERVRNKSTKKKKKKKKSGIQLGSNSKPSEYQSLIKLLGLLAEEWKTSYISSIA